MKSATGKVLIQATSLILAFSITSMSHATTRCVHPTGAGSCYDTIQEAVDDARMGDTIVLRPGRYFENVEVDKSKITITGPREAIVEAGFEIPSADPLDGPGFLIEKNNVKLQGFSIHNGNDHHVEIADDVKATQIIGMSFRNADEETIYGGSGNNNTRIASCRFHSADSDAIDVDGDNVKVENNWFANVGDSAIDIEGDRALVKRNKIFTVENDYPIEVSGDYMNVIENEASNSDDTALYLSGDDAYVYKNKITNIGDLAIEVDGDDARVIGNVLTAVDEGIDVDGSSPQVRNNIVKDVVDDSAIEVDCDALADTCANAKVWDNQVEDIADDAYAYEIDADEGMSIKNNTAKNVIDYGFQLDIDDVLVSGNRVDYAGGDEEPCFEIVGDRNTVTNNKAFWCMGDGFEINGDRNTLQSNRAANTAESGFFVDGGSDYNVLRQNVATDNALNGFLIEEDEDNAGDPTEGNELRNNTASDNLFSVCDDGKDTVVSGNTFPNPYPGTVNKNDGTQDCPNDT